MNILQMAETGGLAEVRRAVHIDPSLANGWKPIMDACFAGRDDLVLILLKAGADPNACALNSHKHRPLVRATEWKKTMPKHEGHVRVVELLIAHGADPSLAGGLYRWCPLAHAAMSGSDPIVLALSRHPESRSMREPHLAAMLYENRRWLRDDARALDDAGRTPLHYLAASGLFHLRGSGAAMHVAERLIDAGAPVNEAQQHPLRTEQRATALWWAIAWHNHLELARCLLEHGADPNTAIHAAATEGYGDALDLLIGHGADVHHRVDGETPLHQAVRCRRPKLVEALMAAGSDPNLKNADGNAALHLAVQAGSRAEVLQALLSHGASASLKNLEGMTAEALASSLNRPDAASLIKNAGRGARARSSAWRPGTRGLPTGQR